MTRPAESELAAGAGPGHEAAGVDGPHDDTGLAGDGQLGAAVRPPGESGHVLHADVLQHGLQGVGTVDGDDRDGVVVEANGQLGSVRVPGHAPHRRRGPVPGGGELSDHVGGRELQVGEDAGVESRAERVERVEEGGQSGGEAVRELVEQQPVEAPHTAALADHTEAS